MKQRKIITGILLFFVAFSAQSFAQVEDMTTNSAKFGAPITTKDAVPATEIKAKLGTLDSMWVRVTGDVTAVCQNRGCWMTMEIGNSETMRVKFKDYGFFVPKNCAGCEATMQGWAYRRVTGVDELRHYAQDAGKSQTEIDSITEPKTEYVYYADGVVLKKKK